MLTQQAASASAPQCVVSLLHLTQTLADRHATLPIQAVPAHFVDLLAEAGRQSVGLCVSCMSHRVQAINLRLATSDLFDVQAGMASGTVSSTSPYTSPLRHVVVSHRKSNMQSKCCRPCLVFLWLLQQLHSEASELLL